MKDKHHILVAGQWQQKNSGVKQILYLNTFASSDSSKHKAGWGGAFKGQLEEEF